ncbi:MAG: 1-deoxy-D-xylulose-5-phosphate synthase [Clostridia bacterium]|nr:1-deoxy-D-xylulose-5-phosphate synthase [Clostridia bacterium]
MEYKILSRINSPEDVKKVNIEDLQALCQEVRHCLIETVSNNGGHLSSNLGTVELTVALHRVFSSPKDSILFDVGHQSYTHKLLTGRFKNFNTLRQENGISGFMRPQESPHDPFITGHSSNSVSAAYGIYKANALNGNNNCVVSVVGDGSFTGGLIYEGLNNAGGGRGNFIIVLNDNKMSISRNVGGMARYLTKIRSKSSYHRFKHKIRKVLEKIPFCGKKIAHTIFNSKTMLKNAIYKSNIFESLGFSYYGPVDGHNIAELENIFKIAKSQNRPAVIHTLTVKGKGYSFAENDPKNYHGVSAFNVAKGADCSVKQNYSEVCGNTLCNLAKNDKKICAITAAMSSGTGLTAFSKNFKNRFFDVGIAEAHAMTFAAGLGIKGLKPYFVVYSSFLQRAYDQLLHDVAIAKIPVKICVDRAGIVGEDGESHQGLFDAAFLSTVPGMQIYSPCYYSELENIIKNSADFDFPCAIRYPRGCEPAYAEKFANNQEYSVFGNSDTAIVTYGRIFANAIDAQAELSKKGINTAVVKLNKIYPFSNDLLKTISKFKNIYFFEEGIKSGGIAEHLLAEISKISNTKFNIIAIENTFVGASSTACAFKKYNLDSDSMVKIIEGNC